jgi:hypothetical protein
MWLLFWFVLSPHSINSRIPHLLSQDLREDVKVVKDYRFNMRICNCVPWFDGENLQWWQSTEAR